MNLQSMAMSWLRKMPVVLGLCVIVAFFYSQNENFLTAGNFTNLMVQMAAVTTIAIGVVFVLLLGEIDLSIGYVSGIAETGTEVVA